MNVVKIDMLGRLYLCCSTFTVVLILGCLADLPFMVVGDWGGQADAPYYTDAQLNVAQQMGVVASSIGAQFVVSLGDHFYDNGVNNVSDPRFNETFENVFAAPSLQVSWYAVCGNHDHIGNCSAEIAYTNLSKRWEMPNFYYTKIFSIPETSSTLQIVFLDTIILAGITYTTSLRYNPPSGPPDPAQADEEWNWIEKTLSSSTADWLIVCGHYPVWSSGHHGPTQVLVDRLQPLLIKYNVAVYFSGHDHDLQFIKPDNASVNYIVSGAGHLIEDSDKHKDDIPHDSLKYRYAPSHHSDLHGGFNSVIVTSTYMNITFYKASGKVDYAVSIPKPERP